MAPVSVTAGSGLIAKRLPSRHTSNLRQGCRHELDVDRRAGAVARFAVEAAPIGIDEQNEMRRHDRRGRDVQTRAALRQIPNCAGDSGPFG